MENGESTLSQRVLIVENFCQRRCGLTIMQADRRSGRASGQSLTDRVQAAHLKAGVTRLRLDVFCCSAQERSIT